MASPLKIPVYVVNENFEVVYRVIPLNLKVSLIIMRRVYLHQLAIGKKKRHFIDTKCYLIPQNKLVYP